MTWIEQLTPEKLLDRYAEGERNFTGATLNECNLAGAQIPHIILRQANLNIANLSTANLSHSDFQQASLNVSRFSGANLSQACLRQAQINVANMIRAVLVGADLSEASLIRSELLRADLSNANLNRANLTEADLRETRFRWAKLREATLNQGDLRKSNLMGANLEGAQLHAAHLGEAVLSSAVLQRAELRHANLVKADLRGANLRGANLRWADLSGAILHEADLTDAKLSGAILIGADLRGATLVNTTLVHADLSNACLQHAYCIGSDWSGATLTGVRLHGAICHNLVVTETTCDWIDLSPQGDQSDIHHFAHGDAIQTFFNRHPPQVQVVIDVAMTQGAHAQLAAAYGMLSEGVSWFKHPPNVEINRRRTVLTFQTEAEVTLMAIAFLAVWPFQDHRALRTSLLELVTTELSPLPPAHGQILSTLEATLSQVDSLGGIDLRQQLEESPFFAAPLQVKLTNGSGQGLDLYHNPRFGVRNFPLDPSRIPQPTQLTAVPPLEDYRAFVDGFQPEPKGHVLTPVP